jgi:hypothetical protein
MANPLTYVSLPFNVIKTHAVNAEVTGHLVNHLVPLLVSMLLAPKHILLNNAASAVLFILSADVGMSPVSPKVFNLPATTSKRYCKHKKDLGRALSLPMCLLLSTHPNASFDATLADPTSTSVQNATEDAVETVPTDGVAPHQTQYIHKILTNCQAHVSALNLNPHLLSSFLGPLKGLI